MNSEEYNSFCRELTEDLMSKYGFNRATAAAIIRYTADELTGTDKDIACYANRLAQFVHTILEYN